MQISKPRLIRFAVIVAMSFNGPNRLHADDKPQAASSSSSDQKRFEPYGYATHEHKASLFGRAVDDDGRPVKGAKVYVIAASNNGRSFHQRLLASGETDADGRYRFDEVVLPVVEFAPQAVPPPIEARFQVFATAKGYGFVWRHTKAFRPEPRPKVAKTPPEDLSHVYFAGEQLSVDLKFSPEIRLHGIITDDQQRPLENASIQVGLTTSDREPFGSPPNMWQCHYLENGPRGVDGAFEGLFVLPEEFRQARSDVDGRYEIRGIPRDCQLLSHFDYQPEYEPRVATLVTGKSEEAGTIALPENGELNHVFVSPSPVHVHVVGRDEQPVANVIVRQESSRMIRRAGALETTDDAGLATLHVMPGAAKLLIEPAIDQPYLPEELTVHVPRGGDERMLSVKLSPAAEVILEAVEKTTGAPIPGVAFLCEDDQGRKPVQSQLSFVDHPRTGAQGTLRAFFRPGSMRFLVDQGRSSTLFEAIAPNGDVLELAANEPTRVRFEFLRREQPAPQAERPELIDEELRPLWELLTKQRAEFGKGNGWYFDVRRNNYLTGEMTPDEVATLLDSFNAKTIDECVEAIRQAFPEFRGLGRTELLTDGIRSRVETHASDDRPVETNVFNGEEYVISMDRGNQLDLFTKENGRRHILAMQDFWDGPARPSPLLARKPNANGEPSTRTIRRVDDTWQITFDSEQTGSQLIINAEHGLRYQQLLRRKPGPIQEWRQYFPLLLPNGLAVPQMSITVYYQPMNRVRMELTIIDKVELLEELPKDAFIVAGQAGANIIDYRTLGRDEIGRGRRPPSGVVHTPVPDIIAHRNRRAPAPEPILKVGDRAPELTVQRWMTAAGDIDAPALAGKILVIDFWGITCGPCVAELEEINATARHFADSKIAIIGLHEGRGTLEKVAELLQKRIVNFPTAIDQSDPAARSMGKTFAAFGVHAIPTCVVVDESGKVAYIGQFKQGIEVAHRLLTAK